MNKEALHLLQTWLFFRDLSFMDIAARFPQVVAEENMAYAQWAPLTRLGDFDQTPGLFYFQDDRFVLFYVDGMNEDLERFSLSELLAYLGEPAAVWSARSGKRHRQYIYPQQGIAFAGVGEEVAFLEIFSPMTLENYRTHLFVEPEQFIR
jgi:hypothetical protein